MRYEIVDGFRGFFLIFMCVIHVNQVTDATIGKLNHHYFGWVEDAQGFIFISGVVVGLVYGKILVEKGFAAMRRKIFSRVRTIYSHQAGLILILFAVSLVLAAFDVFPAILSSYNDVGLAYVVASCVLVAASMHMGILPIYIFFMLATPFVLAAIHRGYAIVVAVGSVLLWFFLGQSGALDLLTQAGEAVLNAAGLSMKLGIFFNIFGWQVLFFMGIYFGLLLQEGKLKFNFLSERKYYYIFLICFGSFVLFGLLDRVVFLSWMVPGFSDHFLTLNSRRDFAPAYVVSFFVDLYLVVWLLTAGRSCGVAFFEYSGAMIQWLFTRRPLVFLGKHSLHVFSFHILLAYAITILLEGRAVSETVGGAILILSVLSLYLPAYAHDRMQARTRAARLEAKGAM